jgi:hypothetical protein
MAARDAVQEDPPPRRRYGIFFAGSKKGVTVSSELTTQDKEFLRAVSIKPDRLSRMRLLPFLLFLVVAFVLLLPLVRRYRLAAPAQRPRPGRRARQRTRSVPDVHP